MVMIIIIRLRSLAEGRACEWLAISFGPAHTMAAQASAVER